MRILALLLFAFIVAVSVAAYMKSDFISIYVYLLPGKDLAGHFLFIGLFSFVINRGFARAKIRGQEIGVFWCTAALVLVFVLEEFSQLLSRSRNFAWSDMGADVGGIVIFGIVAALLPWPKPKAAAEDR